HVPAAAPPGLTLSGRLRVGGREAEILERGRGPGGGGRLQRGVDGGGGILPHYHFVQREFAEALFGDLQRIRTRRQIGQRVFSGGPADGRVDRASGRLSGLHLRARDRGTGGILHNTRNLRCRRLRHGSGAAQYEAQNSFTHAAATLS